jgi:hypothetical protein
MQIMKTHYVVEHARYWPWQFETKYILFFKKVGNLKINFQRRKICEGNRWISRIYHLLRWKFQNQVIIQQPHVVLKLALNNNSNGHNCSWDIWQFSTCLFYSVIFLWLIATLATTSQNWNEKKKTHWGRASNKLCLWEDGFLTLYT